MQRKNKRKRIDHSAKVGEVVVDVEAFVKNKSSENAKKISTIAEHIEIDIYFDKHYFDRQQHGDQEGKRDGIEIDIVKLLLIEAGRHLFYYSIRNKAFSFVNFEVVLRPERIVLTKEVDGDLPLNVVAEYHYIGLNKFEVTLKTAMKIGGFKLSDGQYQVVLHPDGTSTLMRLERSKLLLMSECTY